MLKLLTIIGARPQFIKAAALSRTIRSHFSHQINEILLHTGQHYDDNMSDIFFSEMEIPVPAYNLGVGSASHAMQTANMLVGIEKVIEKEQPDYLVVFGDTNSTLSGAIAAAKMHVPLVHIEAGLRSFNKSMPEEINRIVCDHCSTLMFTPTITGYNNLMNEGFRQNPAKSISSDNPGVFLCGDLMYDNALHFSEPAIGKTTLLRDWNLDPGRFILATIHRDNNTDIPARFEAIAEGMLSIIRLSGLKIVFPIHPRTKKMMEQHPDEQLIYKIKNDPHLILIPPASYLDMMTLEKNCRLVITDSGGVQKEAYFFGKPCIIARSETEWTEIVDNGCAIVSDANEQNIVEAYKYFNTQTSLNFPPLFGDGKAAEFICRELIRHFQDIHKRCQQSPE